MDKEKKIPDFQLNLYFPYLVRMFYRKVSQSVNDVYKTLYGLSVSEWRTMAVLNDFEPLSAKEINLRSSMDKVNVSRSIASLQKNGLLERHIDPADRRRVLLRLTKKGKQIMADLVPRVLEVETRLLEGLNMQEQKTLKSLMQRVSENANRIQPPILESDLLEK